MHSSAPQIVKIISRIQNVKGIQAIVLGGSRARGVHRASSDIDIGIYYDPDIQLDVENLTLCATELDDSHRNNLLTPVGGWGKWINGGGWLTIDALPVDFIYRDILRVSQVIEESKNGRLEMSYQPGHLHGFISSIYMAEIATCKILAEKNDCITKLKTSVSPYPKAFQQALMEKFLWEASFALENGKKAVESSDIVYASGCCFQSTTCILQVLFAVNEQHWMNEKGALSLVNAFPVKPKMIRERIESAFAELRVNPRSIRESISCLEDIVRETKDIANSVR